VPAASSHQCFENFHTTLAVSNGWDCSLSSCCFRMDSPTTASPSSDRNHPKVLNPRRYWRKKKKKKKVSSDQQ
jgi:hypothetical protein